jgi:hypothetical protein
MKKNAFWTNLIFIAVILAVAGGLLAYRALRPKADASTLEAQLTYGDANTVMEIPLDQDAEYDVDTGYYTIHLRVQQGAIRFVDSPCPDHICENYGWISQEDQTAICMPAHAVVMIVSKGTK